MSSAPATTHCFRAINLADLTANVALTLKSKMRSDQEGVREKYRFPFSPMMEKGGKQTQTDHREDISNTW